MSHFMDVCKCGAGINQCRCMSLDKVKTVVQDTCPQCDKKRHRCPEWDYMVICEDDQEFEACLCFK